jgi:hypothetical protein
METVKRQFDKHALHQVVGQRHSPDRTEHAGQYAEARRMEQQDQAGGIAKVKDRHADHVHRLRHP